MTIGAPFFSKSYCNAIAKCARSVNSSEGEDLYTTTCPCLECAKMIIQAGIKNVFYAEEYKSQEGLNLLVKAGIQVTQISDECLQTILRIKDISEEQKEDLYFGDRNKEIKKRMKELEDELRKNSKLASYYMQISNLSKSVDELTKRQG